MEIKNPSDFLTPGIDVQTGDVIVLLNEGSYETLPNSDKEVLQFKVRTPSGDEKKLSMNATSQRWMLEKYGKDSKKWMNVDIEIFIVNQKVFKVFKDVIYLGACPEGTEPKPRTEGEAKPDKKKE